MKIEELYSIFLDCSGVCTDTRKIEKDCLFFALKGENFDGNAFASEALNSGAKYAVIDKDEFAGDDRFILVDDTLKTLQDLSTYHRNSIGIKILSLTGSNGKTTTKELIYDVLATSFNTQATQGNYNNHIGVPLTLLSLERGTEFGIIEMGANHQKEIEFLSSIADPDYGYITNFGKAHLEGFGGVEGVIKGKSELYTHLKNKSGYIFINALDPLQMKVAKQYDKCILVNDPGDPENTCTLLRSSPFVHLKFKGLTIESQLTGAYNFNNISAAISIGNHFGVSPENIKKAIESYIPENNRSQIIKKNSLTIILDAYNANPTSMEAALENFAQYKAERKCAILGDMFELGEDAETEHQAIAELAASLDLDSLFLVGSNFSGVNLPSDKGKLFKTFGELESYLKNYSSDKTTFLIKGSRGMALERVLELI